MTGRGLRSRLANCVLKSATIIGAIKIPPKKAPAIVKVHCLPSPSLAIHRAAGKHGIRTAQISDSVTTAGTRKEPMRTIKKATPKTSAFAVSRP